MKMLLIAAVCFPLSATVVFAESPARDSAEITAAVDQFHRALMAGDATAAMELLAPDAVIFESGSKETREEYAREHLSEDIAFAKSTKSTVSDFAVHRDGNVAWTTAISHTSGMFNGKPVSSAGAELMVLTKSRTTWRIRAIHWSNHKLAKTG